MKLNVDLSGVDVTAEPEWKALPDGTYRAMVTHSEYKETASGFGKCLHLTFTILDGEHETRTVRDFLTLEHKNETPVRIAMEKLKRLALAAGLDGGSVDDSDELHTKPVMVTVSREKADNGYGDDDGFQNRVKKYAKAEDSEVPPAPLPREGDDESAWA